MSKALHKTGGGEAYRPPGRKQGPAMVAALLVLAILLAIIVHTVRILPW